MLLICCSVYDKGACVFSPPMFFRHASEARRSVEQAVKDVRSTLSQYPEQFSLVLLGTFDDTKGSFVELPHEIICQVAEVAPPPERKYGMSEAPK